jgi:hypothetical protein
MRLVAFTVSLPFLAHSCFWLSNHPGPGAVGSGECCSYCGAYCSSATRQRVLSCAVQEDLYTVPEELKGADYLEDKAVKSHSEAMLSGIAEVELPLRYCAVTFRICTYPVLFT